MQPQYCEKCGIDTSFEMYKHNCPGKFWVKAIIQPGTEKEETIYFDQYTHNPDGTITIHIVNRVLIRKVRVKCRCCEKKEGKTDRQCGVQGCQRLTESMGRNTLGRQKFRGKCKDHRSKQ